MNADIMRLKNEINQLRKKNNSIYSNRNYPKHIVFIGQSYNQKSFRKHSPNQSNNSPNTYPYKNTSSKSSTNKFLIKLPFKQGMFSYKNNVSTTLNNNNVNNNNNSNYNYNKTNSSFLAPGLKFNINNDGNDLNNINNNSTKLIINNVSQSKFSSSSLDLNKYKIPFNSSSNLQTKRSGNAYVVNNINNNNIHSMENYNKNNKPINMNNHNNSLEMFHISPILNKKQNPQMSSSFLLGIDEYKLNNSPIKKIIVIILIMKKWKCHLRKI